jgi:hypothetical protein
MEFWRGIHQVGLLEELGKVERLASLERVNDGEPELLQVRTGLAMKIAALYSAAHQFL